MFIQSIQYPAIQRTSIACSQSSSFVCSLSCYNTQRARGQQLPRPRTVVDHVHLPPTTLSEPEVSNCLVPELWLIMFTYKLQHSASQRSAIASSQNRG